MPVKKVKGGYKFGSGKTFKSRAAAERQGRAIKANQSSRKATRRSPRKKAK